MREYTGVLSASTMIGDNVRNQQGEDLGKLEEIMLDLETGKVAYAVLSFGGFLGLGDKLFAIPWKALRVDEENEEVVLNVSKEKLKDAPGFDKDHWPRSSDREFLRQIDTYYGYKSDW